MLLGRAVESLGRGKGLHVCYGKDEVGWIFSLPLGKAEWATR
jgi:hypothetical protein